MGSGDRLRYNGYEGVHPCGETRSVAMSGNVKKTLTWAGIAFVAWFLFTQPEQSASLVTGLVSMLQQAAEAVITFFESLV